MRFCSVELMLGGGWFSILLGGREVRKSCTLVVSLFLMFVSISSVERLFVGGLGKFCLNRNRDCFSCSLVVFDL